MNPNNVVGTPNMQTQPVAPAEPEVNPMTMGPKKSGKGGIIAVILFALLAAGGIGFGVYTMMNSKKQEDALNEQIATLKKQNSELMEKIAEGGEGSESSASTNAWDDFSKNMVSETMSIMGEYPFYNGSENVYYVMHANKNNSGHLTIVDDSVDNATILELDDVLAIYYVRIGNGSVPYFYIIGFDGGVSRINLLENSGRQLEKVGDYTKIVAVFVGDDLAANLVDIDGNIYKTN